MPPMLWRLVPGDRPERQSECLSYADPRILPIFAAPSGPTCLYPTTGAPVSAMRQRPFLFAVRLSAPCCLHRLRSLAFDQLMVAVQCLMDAVKYPIRSNNFGEVVTVQ